MTIHLGLVAFADSEEDMAAFLASFVSAERGTTDSSYEVEVDADDPDAAAEIVDAAGDEHGVTIVAVTYRS